MRLNYQARSSYPPAPLLQAKGFGINENPYRPDKGDQVGLLKTDNYPEEEQRALEL